MTDRRGRRGERPSELEPLVLTFLAHLKRSSYSPQSIRLYRGDLRRFLAWCRDRDVLRLSDIETGVIESYRRTLETYPGRSGPITPASVRRHLASLRGFFRVLVSMGKIARNPVALASADAAPPNDVSFREGPFGNLVTLHLEGLAAKGYSQDTLAARRKQLFDFVRTIQASGVTSPSGVTAQIASEWLDPFPPRLRYLSLLALRRFFHWLVRKDHLLENPISGLEAREPPKGRRMPVTHEVIEDLCNEIDLATPEGLRDRAMVEVIYSTAMRRMELAGLDLDDLDTSNRTITIRRGKGDKSRVVPIGPRALRWVERYLVEARGLLESRHIHARAPRALFLNHFGERLRPHGVGDRVRLWAKAAGLRQDLGAHVIRHTTATLMLERGADVRSLQELLGHARVTTTAEYTKVAIVDLKAVHRRTHPAERDEPEAADPNEHPQG